MSRRKGIDKNRLIARQKLYRQVHKTRIRAYQKVYNQAYGAKLRAAVLVFLGGKCIRCGFSDSRALQIDHIHGGGGKESKQIHNRGICQRVLEGKPGYQLLCANCNWIKRTENSEVPKGQHLENGKGLTA